MRTENQRKKDQFLESIKNYVPDSSDMTSMPLQSQSPVIESLICSHCGYQNKNAKICKNCGSTLD